MQTAREDGEPFRILLVEDSPGDVRLTQEAFREANRRSSARGVRRRRGHGLSETRGRPCRRAAPGSHPAGSEPAQDGWPRGAGAHQGRWSLKTIPTVILTTSEAEADIVKSYQLQANCYLSKPVQLDAFEVLVRSINDFWLTKVKLAAADRKAG